MSNVIALSVPARRQGRELRRTALIAGFARHRRAQGEEPWLRENAALLNILETTGLPLAAGALAPHEPFYAQLERRVGFFPQSYRPLLSICLDLEDLGMPGRKGEALAHWVSRAELADAELSDLARLEARRLMARRGIDPLPEDEALEERIRAFIDRSGTFAVPDRNAVHALTHIVFYLSEYGRRDPELSLAAKTSLEFAGLLAWLDQNAATLAEICLAMRHAGANPPAIWENWLERETRRFAVFTAPQVGRVDDYRAYLACNWLMAQAGRAAFCEMMPAGQMVFRRALRAPGPLHEISERLFRMGDARCDDWAMMRPYLDVGLGDAGQDILNAAERSSAAFAEFFAAFARTGLCGASL